MIPARRRLVSFLHYVVAAGEPGRRRISVCGGFEIALRSLEQLALFEPDMSGHPLGKSLQRLRIGRFQCGRDGTQIGMIGQGAFNQITFACPCQKPKDAGFLGLEMRQEFAGEGFHDLPGDCFNLRRIAGAGGQPGVPRPFQRFVVMVPGKINECRMAFHFVARNRQRIRAKCQSNKANHR